MIYATHVYSILLKFSCAGRARVNFNSQLEKIFVVTLKKNTFGVKLVCSIVHFMTSKPLCMFDSRKNDG